MMLFEYHVCDLTPFQVHCSSVCVHLNLSYSTFSFIDGENNFPVAESWGNCFEAGMSAVVSLCPGTLLLWGKYLCSFAGAANHTIIVSVPGHRGRQPA